MLRLLYLARPVAVEAAPALPSLLPPRCARGAADEIVVCRSREASPRYGPRLPDAAAPLPSQVEFGLFGKARMGIAGQQRGLPGGVSVPAAMTTVRVPF